MADEWEVLHDLEKLNLDDVKEPPCSGCYWWDPAFEYDESGRTGVAFCRCEQMECDFSCFRPKRTPRSRLAEGTSSLQGSESGLGKDAHQSQD